MGVKHYSNNWVTYAELTTAPKDMTESLVLQSLTEATGDRGHKVYELSNHLGNVLATVSDKKLGQLLGGSIVASYYEAQVQSASDYYPFGWNLPGRTYSSGEDYRFGFNGKENDKDFGNQLIQDYGFRLYNPAIAKFLSVDPLAPEYPWYTPYQFAGNMPIKFIDLDGLEPAEPGKEYGEIVSSEDQNSGESGEYIWYGGNAGWLAVDGTNEVEVSQWKKDWENFIEYPNVEPSTSMRGTPLFNTKLDMGRHLTFKNNEQVIESADGLLNLVSQSLGGADIVYLEGGIREDVKNDPTMLRLEQELINEAKVLHAKKGKSFYLTGIRSAVGFGGQRDASVWGDNVASIATNRLTWALRHATVKYWIDVNDNGSMLIQYRLYDYLDLSPSGTTRSGAYNNISSVLGFLYHGVADGNRNLQTRVEWFTPVDLVKKVPK